MDRFLVKAYRRLPKWVKRGVPPELRDWLLRMLMYVDSRPNMHSLRLRHSAMMAGRRRDWVESMAHWQYLAALSNSTLIHQANDNDPPDDETTRRTTYARNELRRARIQRARELLAQGKIRPFRELVSRIVESIPDQRVFKNDKQILDIVRLYIQDALQADGIPRPEPLAVGTLAKPVTDPLCIVFCLDVLKVSNVHTHARVIFAICKNLLALDPRIQTHVIITNERFGVTTPIVAQSFTPTNKDTVENLAKKAFPDDYDTRFFFHMFRDSGLEGILRSCKKILKIAPDVVLYGGGHKGFFSNESRVVRHCLYDYLPTGFFFIQSNNEVDPKLDMIIARGPHPVVGNSGTAAVRIQPYPTITEGPIETVLRPERQAGKIIISAITGVRMDLKMNEQSDADMRAFLSVLDKTPGSVWHFIGASDPAKVAASNTLIAERVAAGQIVVHPVLPMAEFTALVGQAALFLHLPGFTGGSGGATVARRAGIPILTFRHSDVAGRQPPETVFEATDATGFSTMATRLLNDLEFWTSTVHSQFAHTNWIRDHAPEGFYDCLREACRIGADRLSRPKEDQKDEQDDKDTGIKNVGIKDTGTPAAPAQESA